MTIRAAVPADAAALAALSGELGYPATAEQVLERLAAMGSSQTVLVFDDGEVRGRIEVIEALRLESGRFAEITGLVVTETARGRGVGRGRRGVGARSRPEESARPLERHP